MKKLTLFYFILFFINFSCKKDSSNVLLNEITTIENNLLPAIHVTDDSIKTYNLTERMKYYNIPGVSIAIVENGQLKWAKGYGISDTETGKKVDSNTLFQAGSISKPVAALAVLKLAEENKVNLDQDVNTYLQGWKVPENTLTQGEKVTLRKLLTHTAGMTVHGFPGYKQTDTFPTTTDVLNGLGNTPKITIDTIPGSIWRYSGGGYTVMQKVVEEVTKQSFEDYINTAILQPFNMKNSTYSQPIDSTKYTNISAAYNRKGKMIEGKWNNYPEKAAAGLWTTPSDLAKYCTEIQQISKENKKGVLHKKTVEAMLTKHKNNWGLGPSLQWESDSLVFRHGGKNAGFTNEMIAFAHRGNAVIVMTNADNGGKLIGEVLRGVSQYYKWGVSNQQAIKAIEIPIETLNEYTGTYQLNFQVPNIGDYFVEITIKNNHLCIYDPNNGELNILTPTAPSTFIDTDTGEKVSIQSDNNNLAMIFNNRYTFHRVKN